MPLQSNAAPTTPRRHSSISARRVFVREKVITKQDKWPIVDDYRYLNKGLARQPASHDSQSVAVKILDEKHRLERRAHRVKANMDESDASYLAKEMDRMLSTANPMCQSKLFKVIRKSITTLTNKTLSAGESGERTNNLNYNKLQTQHKVPKQSRSVEQNVVLSKGVSNVSSANVLPVASILSSVRHKQRTRKSFSKDTGERLAREPSTATTPKSKSNEPTISIIESSKPNMLHRCYGKQNVKASPQVNKHTKKSINICQRPSIPKTTQNSINNRSLNQSQLHINNKQMKTIYENEQFVKQKEITPSTSGSTSYSSLEQKESLHGIIKKTNSPKSEVYEVKNKQKSKKKLQNKHKNGKNKVAVDCENLQENEQDDSLVQRLTSFWNSKVNGDANGVVVNDSGTGTSDESTTISSQTSLTNRKLSYKINENISTTSDNAQSSSHKICQPNMVQRKGREDVRNTKDDDFEITQLSDMKLGLLNELIQALERNNSEKSLQDEVHKSSCIDISDAKNGGNSRTNIEVKSSNNNIDVELSSSSDTYDNFEEDLNAKKSDNEGTCGSDNDVVDNKNEGTIHFNTSCLVINAPLHNLEESKCKDHDDTEIMEVNECDSIHDTIENNIQIITQEVLQYEEEVIHLTGHDSSKNIEITDSNQSEVGNNSDKICETEENPRIQTCVTNVNDIIINLRSMIHEIESIPDDIKVMAMDLNVLPISNELCETLSIMVDNKTSKAENIAVDTTDDKPLIDSKEPCATTEVDTTSATIYNQNVLSLNNEYEQVISENAINNFKIENIYRLYHLPTTFTIPILEGVLNNLQVVLFPKRHDYLKTRCKTFIVERRNKEDIVKKGSKHIINDDEKGLLKYDCNNNDESALTYVTRFNRKSPYQSTVYYMTTKPKGLMTTTCPSVMFHPLQKTDSTMVQTNKLNGSSESRKEEETITKIKSKMDLIRTCSKQSQGYLNMNQKRSIILTTSYDENVIVNLNNIADNEDASFHKSGNINFVVDAHTESDTNMNRLDTIRSNNISRCIFQNVNADEISDSAGGSGDFGTPCLRTSSMSVMASGSLNESNSQSEVNTNDSEHRSGVAISQSEIIHEADEEHLAYNDDCLNRINYQTPDTFRSNATTLVDSCSSQEENASNSNMAVISDNNRCISLSTQQKETSTTGLNTYNPKLTSTRDVGTMATCPSTIYNNIDNVNNINSDNRLPKNYVVLCCKADTPLCTHKQKSRDTSNKKLEKLLKNDPTLRQELGDLIDIDNLCEKERKLIMVCLVLIKRNASVQNTLMAFLLHTINKILTALWTTTKHKVIGKIHKLAKTKRHQRQTDTDDYVLSCQYKHLIKIIYTTLVSLTLCFLIQKNVCGMNLPVRFPW